MKQANEAELLEEDKEDNRSVKSLHSLNDDKHSSDKRQVENKIASFLESDETEDKKVKAADFNDLRSFTQMPAIIDDLLPNTA